MLRSCGKPLFYIVCILLYIFVFSIDAMTKDVGTIVLKSGEKYENVLYEINDFYKVVKFKYEGKRINVSFTEVAAIYDRRNRDITKHILGKHYRPPGETWLPGDSDVMKKAREKRWKILIRAGGNFSIPTGEYYEGIGPGIGFGGSVVFPLDHQLAIKAIISKSGMKVKDDFRLYLGDPDFSLVNQDYHISTVRYILAAEYYRNMSENRDDKSMWYVYSGLGVAVHYISMKAVLRYNPTGEQVAISDDGNKSKFAFSSGFGLAQMVYRNIGISFDSNLDLVYADTGSRDPDGWGYNLAFILDFKIGIAVFL